MKEEEEKFFYERLLVNIYGINDWKKLWFYKFFFFNIIGLGKEYE